MKKDNPSPEFTNADAALRLTRLSESGIIAIAYFVKDFLITDANDTFLNLFGIKRNDLRAGNIHWNKYTLEKWLPRTLQAIGELKDTGVLPPYEKEFRRADGSTGWGLFSGAMFDEENGITFVIDITERKRAEAVLRDSEERHTFLLKLSDVIREEQNADALGLHATQLLAEHMSVDRCWITQLSQEEGVSRLGPEYHAAELPPISGEYRTAGLPGPLRQAETGPLIFSDVANDPQLTEPDKAGLKAMGFGAYLAAIMRKGERNYTWALAVATTTPRNWTNAELTLMEDAAERIWSAAERAKAQAALRNSEITRRMALEAFNIGMTIWYPQEDYTDSDDRFFELFGLKQGDIINRETALNKLIHPDDSDRYAGLVIKALDPAGDGKLYDEYRVIYPDGSIHWLATTGQTIFEGKPAAPARMYGMVQDITIRKEAEQLRQHAEAEYRVKLETEVRERTAELQENHRLIETIYNTIQVGMSIFKPVYDGDEIMDFKIMIVNKRIEESSGRKDLPGKLYAQEFPGIKKMGLFEAMCKAMTSGKAEKIDYQYTFEGINQHYSTLFIRNGNLLVASNLHMTEQKQAEERVRELEAEQQQEIVRATLNALEEERFRISESLHNGLGQLLYGIKINMSVLDQGQHPKEFEHIKNYTLKLLGDSIKESRRISHELMPKTLEEFGLKVAIDDICEQLQGNVMFTCHFYPDTIRLEKYLELAVYRSLQELMMNVVKHAQATTCLVEVTVNKEDIKILVSDNGHGMEVSVNQKTGIGLSAIRSKVKLMNGEVKITSNKGAGTTVEVTIPIPKQA